MQPGLNVEYSGSQPRDYDKVHVLPLQPVAYPISGVCPYYSRGCHHGKPRDNKFLTCESQLTGEKVVSTSTPR